LICWASISFLGWLLIRRNPKYLNSAKQREAAGQTELPEEMKNYVTWREAIRTRRFWHLSLISTIGSFQALYIANVYKIAADEFLGDHTLTLAATLGGIMNGLSRFLWSALQDKFGFRTIYGIISLI